MARKNAKTPPGIPKGYEAGSKQFKITTEQSFYPKMKQPRAIKSGSKPKPYVQPVRITNPGALKPKKR